MSILSIQLAREIVARTMAILPHNINVMDENGTIIGSGDPSRYGERHEGALLAIRQNRIVEIDLLAASRLQGVRLGVNLPLRHAGQTIGAIGISGEPELVRQYGELLRMSAEMMLEQKQLLFAMERDARLSEELVLKLVNGEAASDTLLQQWALQLNVDLAKPRIALVIHANHTELDLAALQALQQQLIAAKSDQLVARRSLHEFIVLYPALDARQQWQAQQLFSELERWLNTLQIENKLKLHAALGHYFSQADGIALSYQTASATLQQPMAHRPLLQAFEQQRLPVLLSPLASGWQAEFFRRPIQRLALHDKDQALYQTLQSWFDHDLHYAQTAQALHIHRNTLDYRLQRITELTQLDLSRLEERIQLYIALQIDALMDHASR